MITPGLTRRNFLAGVGMAGAAAVLGGCATSVSGNSGQTGGAVTVESNLSAPQAKAAMQALIAEYDKRGSTQASLNTVAAETYRTQLPTYLTSANPPDLYTWYAGSVARSYADKGLLLDLSDIWRTMGTYTPALRAMSTD
ncbi:MAG TPA: extracellular solute-binding protein, partial [Pseudonocardiaceae bacterium]